MDSVTCGTRAQCGQGAPVSRFSDFFANILCNFLGEGSTPMKVCTSGGQYEHEHIHATTGIRTNDSSIRCVKDGTLYRVVRFDQHNSISISSNVHSNKTEKEEGRGKKRTINMQYGSAICRMCGRVGWGDNQCVRNFRGSGPLRNCTIGIPVRGRRLRLGSGPRKIVPYTCIG